MGVGGGEEEEGEVQKARMITSIRARIRCRGRLRGRPREGENRRKPRSTQGPSSNALLGPASECSRKRLMSGSEPIIVRARRAYRRGEGKVYALERNALRAGHPTYPPFQVSGWRNAISTSQERTTCGW
jgi:hypothetical protein